MYSIQFENSTHELIINDASKSLIKILKIYLESFVHVEIGSNLVRSEYSNSNRTVLWDQNVFLSESSWLKYLASMHSEYSEETKPVAKNSKVCVGYTMK